MVVQWPTGVALFLLVQQLEGRKRTVIQTYSIRRAVKENTLGGFSEWREEGKWLNPVCVLCSGKGEKQSVTWLLSLKSFLLCGFREQIFFFFFNVRAVSKWREPESLPQSMQHVAQRQQVQKSPDGSHRAGLVQVVAAGGDAAQTCCCAWAEDRWKTFNAHSLLSSYQFMCILSKMQVPFVQHMFCADLFRKQVGVYSVCSNGWKPFLILKSQFSCRQKCHATQ